MLLKTHRLLQHSVSRNAFALTINQISNYIIPLLLIPFLTKALGVSVFGHVAITLSAIQICFILTDYGFSLSATQAISINRNNHSYIESKISRIFYTKLLLTILACTALVIVPEAIKQLKDIKNLFIAGTIAVIAQSFQPTWLFQGIEQMKNITLYNVVTRLLYVGLVISFVREPTDAIKVIYFWGVANSFGLIASILLMKTSGYHLRLISLNEILEELRESADFFWSRLAVSTYTAASILIIGIQSPIQAAQFSVCEQIYKAAQNVTSPVSSALFPYMAKHRDWKLFGRVISTIAVVLSIGCFFFWLLSPKIVSILFGEVYVAALPTLSIFLITTIINYLGVSFGYSAFSALNRTDIANKTVLFGAMLHLTCLFFLFQLSSITAFTVALAILATESTVMLMRLAFLIFLYRKYTSSK